MKLNPNLTLPVYLMNLLMNVEDTGRLQEIVLRKSTIANILRAGKLLAKAI